MLFLPAFKKKKKKTPSKPRLPEVSPRLSESLGLQDAAVTAAALQSWQSFIILQR